jgi:hypothetical protein
MAKQRGTIFQRGKRWVAEVSLGRDSTGKRLRNTIYGNSA